MFGVYSPPKSKVESRLADEASSIGFFSEITSKRFGSGVSSPALAYNALLLLPILFKRDLVDESLFVLKEAPLRVFIPTGTA